MVCICEDDGIDADCEVHGTMTDQEQAPLDWLPQFEEVFLSHWREHPDHYSGLGWPLTVPQIEALVAALKAAQQRAGRAEVDLGSWVLDNDQLRADLTRVEAEAKKWQEEAEQIHREDTELESRYEAALARIADLEVAVDMTPDYLGRTKLVYATEVIGLRKDLATERNRIAELEGSLRETADELARCNPDDPLYKSHAEERARAVLEPQTPSAS